MPAYLSAQKNRAQDLAQALDSLSGIQIRSIWHGASLFLGARLATIISHGSCEQPLLPGSFYD
jgi:hypothetical protein